MNWGWIVVGAVVAYTVIVECAIKPRRWRRDYWTDWQAHNEAAFHPKRTLVGGVVDRFERNVTIGDALLIRRRP